MDYKSAKERILAAEKLLNESSTTKEKFESVRVLLRGINPRIDGIVDTCSRELGKFEKLQKGDVIELTVEALPDDSEEEKKRKKALLLFIRLWKNLRGEVERVQKEFEQTKETSREQIKSAGRIVALAKGPLGIITGLALVIVVGISFMQSGRSPTTSPSPMSTSEASSVAKIQVIVVSGEKVPLTEVESVSGPECEGPHYHAKDRVAAQSIDGTVISDPGGCGLGKVSELPIEEVPASE